MAKYRFVWMLRQSMDNKGVTHSTVRRVTEGVLNSVENSGKLKLYPGCGDFRFSRTQWWKHWQGWRIQGNRLMMAIRSIDKRLTAFHQTAFGKIIVWGLVAVIGTVLVFFTQRILSTCYPDVMPPPIHGYEQM